ncbi:MAG: DNA polymerase III subunit alpha [Candidatus Zambryskibacteria bacterium]|nr:DNA polymerase III subunit alpha [Candidatus Zambryskibacteria bacterium]
MQKFVHLHTHSHYSLLEALPKIPNLVKKARLSGYEALALTDSGNLYGAIEFYKECKEAEIKPIIGVDFYMAARSRTDKEARVDNRQSRLVLLAENLDGYKNLLKLVTYSYLEGFYYKPRIDRELLEKYNNGLIAIAREPKYYREIFDNRFYRGIGPDDLAVSPPSDGIPIVATYNVHYLEPSDRPVLETIRSIQEHPNRSGTFDDEADLSFRTPEEAVDNFKKIPEALENSVKIAEKCNLELELGKWVFPNFDIESGFAPDEELRQRVYEGFAQREVKKSDENVKRVEYELNIIKTKGFGKYFLVVADLMYYARKHSILSNIRGSVSGSMVTFLAGITNIDPIKYEIPFERFLNPDRPSPPDIDMDIADNRRDELIGYAIKKYGEDHVAQIGTFGTMLARGAVRDITRALGYSYELGDKIAKLIPFGAQGFPMTIDRAMKENPDLKKLYEEDKDTKTILDTAKKIEGNARHVSVHAAGVVISPKPLIEYTPLQYDNTKGEKKIITQYDMYSLDPNAGGDMTVGLLKFDILGIRNLSIIADTLERIKKIEGKELELDKIPINDKKTFEMLARGETEGTFQLNGPSMTRFLMDLKPTTIHDINAMVALYRPGPMQFIPLFIERKHKPSLVRYLDPALKPILEKTYGVLVYQDDLLIIAKEIAGYSWGEVDKFRKAVGKKIPEEMRAQKEKFIKGVVEHSKWPQKKAEELWTWIEPFAAYGFNKAHSVSYGWIAYITSYLKANFPAIYMSAVLTAESGDIETVGIMVNECKRMGIEVLPPSINESFSQFSVIGPVPYKIRFGLTTIKNFGQDISSAITAERKVNGKFKNLADFLSRIKNKNLNKKSLEALIKCGALDEFEERGKLLTNLDRLLEYYRETINAPKNQEALFESASLPALRLENAPEASQKEKLGWEKELLGLYISSHPLEPYREKISALKINIEKLSKLRENTETVIAGLVEQARDVLTKNNERMVFMRLSDFSGAVEVAIFPRVLSEFRAFVQPDACIAIKGRVSRRSGVISFIAEKIKAL